MEVPSAYYFCLFQHALNIDGVNSTRVYSNFMLRVRYFPFHSACEFLATPHKCTVFISLPILSWESWAPVLAMPCCRGLTRPKQLSMATYILSSNFFFFLEGGGVVIGLILSTIVAFVRFLAIFFLSTLLILLRLRCTFKQKHTTKPKQTESSLIVQVY